ncbi:enoyl-CoA hydratase/isomerase family protein (plasmid) [Polaromonas sp. P1-6]|nr:enoyl-CoA hydratase/isomerase family protein [Polaromonas sp. P1-6]
MTLTPPTFETLRFEVADHVATLILNRPDCRNALNLQMCRDIVAACEHARGNDTIRVMLVKAAGSVFCAGADLKERQGMTSADMLARRVEGFTAYDALEQLEIPVIAVVQGAAFGSGGEIAAACDFVLGSTEAAFKYPEVGWGTVGATQRLPRIVGRRMAKELLYTGRVVDAAEALSLGLLNHVHAPDQLDAVADAMAAAIAKSNPLTVRLTKHSIDAGLETTRHGAMAVELLAIQENLRHSDWKGAIAAFGNRSEKKHAV